MEDLKLRIKEIKIIFEDQDGKEYSRTGKKKEVNMKHFIWEMVQVYYNHYKPIMMTKNKKQPVIYSAKRPVIDKAKIEFDNDFNIF